MTNANQVVFSWKRQATPSGLQVSFREDWGWKAMLEQELAEAYVGTEESLRDLQREGERPADQRLLRHGVHAYTDGSWYESSGRVASAFIITDPKSRVIVFKGGGNDKYKPALDYAEGLIHNTVKMSSTRAEGEGLLRLHIGLLIAKATQEEPTTGVDSQSAINVYNKLERLTPLHRINLPNHDVWELVRELKMLCGSVNPYYVESHMDDFVTGTREEKLEQLNSHWRGNFLADEETEVAHEHGSDLSHRTLAALSRAVVWYDNGDVPSPVLVPYVRWARETVQHSHMVQYVAKHPLADQGVDWESSIALRKAKEGIAERIRVMKIMWNLYAYGDVKLLRKHCTPSEAMCAWCDESLETRDHILGKSCDSPVLAKHKGILYKQITDKIKEHLRDEDTEEWLSLTVPIIWGGVGHNSNSIGDARIRDMVEGLSDWKPQELWRGVVPKRLQTMLECYSIKGNVRKLAQELVTITEHASTDLWLLTNERKQSDIIAPIGRSLNDQARDIYAVSPALLGRPISEFDELPKPHKVNIIRDRKRKHA